MEVEVWADIACPWCYVGKRRFEAALAGFEHRDQVRVRWRSFELDPLAPRERAKDAASHLAEKYGTTRERALEMQRAMAEAAERDGLELRFDIARGGNTFDAHRLVHLAAAHGAEDAMAERLFRAYLSEGEPIGDPAVLGRLALDAGLPEAEVREVLATNRFAEDVRADERAAAAFGIHAVPFYVVDRRLGAAGAHPPAALRRLLARGRDERSPLATGSRRGEHEAERAGPQGR